MHPLHLGGGSPHRPRTPPPLVLPLACPPRLLCCPSLTLPRLCVQGKPYDSSITASLQPGPDTYWPSLNGGSSDTFWSHEWDKHGRCATDILPDQRAYFAGALDLLARFNITAALAVHGLFPTNAGTLSMAAIDAALVAELGFTATFKCDSYQRIETVTQCVDKNLNLRACNAASKCPANVWLPAAQEEPVEPVAPVRPPAGPPPPPYPPGAAPSQCVTFPQVPSGGVMPIEDATWVFARSADCPAVCTVCSAGCLFCSAAWDGTGKPPNVGYDLSASGSWLGVDSGAQECSRYGADLETGAHVRVSGMTGTYSPKTGTRVSSAGSSCGEWGLA